MHILELARMMEETNGKCLKQVNQEDFWLFILHAIFTAIGFGRIVEEMGNAKAG